MAEKLSVRIETRITPTQSRQIEHECRADGRSHSEFVREAVLVFVSLPEDERSRLAREARVAAVRTPAKPR